MSNLSIEEKIDYIYNELRFQKKLKTWKIIIKVLILLVLWLSIFLFIQNTNKENISAIISEKLSNYDIDALINMAGIGIYKALDQLEHEDFEESLLVNVFAPFFLIKAVYKKLQSSRLWI